MKREECECDLQFAGFVVIACPLKTDSKAAIKQIQESSHHVRIEDCIRKQKKSNIVLLDLSLEFTGFSTNASSSATLLL